MKKIILSGFLAACFSTFSSFAQPAMNGSNYLMTHGVTFNYMYGFWDNDYDMGNPGNGETWDLTGGIGSEFEYSTNVVAAANGPGGSSFPGAETAISPGFSAEYLTLNSSEYTVYGAYQNDIVVYYDDREILCEFPMSFGTVNNDDFHSNFVASENYERTGSVESTYDGYGTLITPLGTLENVYRLKIVEDYFDDAPGTDLDIQVNTENYQFFKDGIPGPVANIVNTTFWGSTTSTILYRTDILTHTVEYQKKQVVIYPNPARDRVTLQGLDLFQKSELTVFSSTGSIVIMERLNNQEVNISSLSPGVYIFQIISGDSIMRKRIVVE